MNNETSIFVDGNCIVCDLEISHYKRLAPQNFKIVDISAPDFDAQKFGLTAAAVNKHIHVQTPDGQMLTGVNAFAHIWTRIPKYNFASKLIRLPIIYSVAKIGYEIFVVIRPWLPKKKRH